MNFQRFIYILHSRAKLILFTFLVAVFVAVAVSLLMPKEYEASTSLVMDFKDPNPISGQASALNPQILPAYMSTQLDILKSKAVAEKVVENLKLDQDPKNREAFMEATEGRGSIREWLAVGLLENLVAEPSKDSGVVAVTYTANDPRMAAAVANAFAAAYMQTTLALRVDPAKQSATLFDDQLNALRKNWEKAQATLSAYQQRNGIIDVDERLDVENARLSDLSNQLVQAQASAFESSSRNSTAGKLGGGADTMPEVLASPLVQNLKSQLYQKEAELNELATSLNPSHPQYKEVAAQVAGLRTRVNQEISKIVSGVRNNNSIQQSREAAIRQALAEQKAKVLEIKRKRDQMAVLVRDVDTAQKAYDTALQRFTQARMESQVSMNNVSVLSQATAPVLPSKPKLLFNVLGAGVLGLGLGLLLAILFEMMDRRVRSEADIFDAIGVPVLGVVSKEVGHDRFAGTWPRLEGLAPKALPNPAK
ncbi:chain length determinant protein EpsF [Thermithiobacillus plumbiphilus]|uniref:Chain length determinant protein EpsF n=1 Tax=Thermithiobacillus plumbiphilus TaxID=1729899 RepID=A0ABU9D5Q1_9PROT